MINKRGSKRAKIILKKYNSDQIQMGLDLFNDSKKELVPGLRVYVALCILEEFMKERNFVMIPRYLGTEDDVDMFSYIDGKVAEYPRTISDNALIEVVKFLKEFHRISQERLGYGKTYIHGDLNTKHLVFKSP